MNIAWWFLHHNTGCSKILEGPTHSNTTPKKLFWVLKTLSCTWRYINVKYFLTWHDSVSSVLQCVVITPLPQSSGTVTVRDRKTIWMSHVIAALWNLVIRFTFLHLKALKHTKKQQSGYRKTVQDTLTIIQAFRGNKQLMITWWFLSVGKVNVVMSKSQDGKKMSQNWSQAEWRQTANK